MVALLIAVSVTGGCRTLGKSRQTRALTTARGLSIQGHSELQQQRYIEAEGTFAEALKHSEADERAHWGMAEVLWHQGQRQAAIEHMSLAAKLSGSRADLLVRLGEMYYSEGLLDDALAHADEALAGHRDNCSAWALRGKVIQDRGDLEDALYSYHRALHLQEHYPDVQLAVAEIYRKIGRPQRALHTLDTMLDTETGGEIPAEAWLLKGQALADLGEQADAKMLLRQAALCCDEEDTKLLLDVAQSQIDFGDLAEARICLGRALHQNPYNPHALKIQETLDSSFQSNLPTTMLIKQTTPLPNGGN